MTHQRPRRRPRTGFTLSELLVSLTLTVSIFAAAVPFFSMQMRQLQQDVGRAEAQQTARFAQNMVDRELRNIGIAVTPMQVGLGIPRNQPKIVQASGFAVTFNSNLVANDTIDVSAVYYDPNVLPALTAALPSVSSVVLPLSSTPYPDYVYRDANGVLSGAETVSYWASVDSTAPSSDHYVLFRRVNDGAVTVVARGLRIPAGTPLFQYRRVMPTGAIDTIPNAQLPVFWNSASGIADSIRTVTMRARGVFTGYTLDNKPRTYERGVATQTNMPNVGLSQRSACGDIPLNPGTPSTTVVLVGGVTERVQVTFGKSNDETAGENDVERYAVFRRLVGDPWGEAIAVVGKSGGPYMWEDFDIQLGNSFQYGVAAQDCSPANSTMMTSSAITH